MTTDEIPEVDPTEDPNRGYFPDNRTLEDQLPDPDQDPKDLGVGFYETTAVMANDVAGDFKVVSVEGEHDANSSD